MTYFGWSYPAGCTGTPADEMPDPSPESEEVYELLEDLVEQEVLDKVVKIIDELAWKADHCPTCERLMVEGETTALADIDNGILQKSRSNT